MKPKDLGKEMIDAASDLRKEITKTNKEQVKQRDLYKEWRKGLTGVLIDLHWFRILGSQSRVLGLAFNLMGKSLGYVVDMILLPMIPSIIEVATWLFKLGNTIAALPKPFRNAIAVVGALVVGMTTFATLLLYTSIALKMFAASLKSGTIGNVAGAAGAAGAGAAGAAVGFFPKLGFGSFFAPEMFPALGKLGGKGEYTHNPIERIKMFAEMFGLKGFQEGAIVNKPTLGLFGEAGAEAIIPLSKIAEVVGGILGSVVGFTSTLTQSAQGRGGGVGGGMTGGTNQMMIQLAKGFGWVVDSVSSGFKTTNELLAGILALLAQFFGGTPPGTNDKDIIKKITDIINTAFLTIPVIIGSIAKTAWDNIISIAKGVWEGIFSLAKVAWDTILNVGQSVWDILLYTGTTAWQTITAIAASAWTTINEIANTAWQTISNTISTSWETLIATLKTNFDTVVNAAHAGLDEFLDSADEKWRELIEKAKGGLDEIFKVAKDGFTQVVTSILEFINKQVIGKGTTTQTGGGTTTGGKTLTKTLPVHDETGGIAGYWYYYSDGSYEYKEGGGTPTTGTLPEPTGTAYPNFGSVPGEGSGAGGRSGNAPNESPPSYSDVFTTVVNKGIDIVTDVVDSVSKFVTPVVDSIKNVIDTPVKVAEVVVNEVVNTATNIINATTMLGTAISNTITNAANFIRGFLPEQERAGNGDAAAAVGASSGAVPLIASASSAIPQFQSGGIMPHTGLAFLHEGETVIPKTGVQSGQQIVINNPVFNISGRTDRELFENFMRLMKTEGMRVH